MPQQHYRCPNCGTIDLITYTVADTTGPDWPPTCTTPECFDVRMEMFPMQMLTDLRTDGEGEKQFQKFGVWREVPTKQGRTQVYEEIDSLHKLRQIEKDSEQRYRDGEGEPLRFRMAAQNRSNKDVGLFGMDGQIGDQHYDSGKTPSKQKPMQVRRHGERKPKIRVARHGGVSPLKG